MFIFSQCFILPAENDVLFCKVWVYVIMQSGKGFLVFI